MATNIQTKRRVRAAAIVISERTGCGCWVKRRYLCANCEDTAEAALAAAWDVS